MIKNLVYSSLILFYNVILKRGKHRETKKKLLRIITDYILPFDDSQIINTALELITLFTKDEKDQETINLIF